MEKTGSSPGYQSASFSEELGTLPLVDSIVDLYDSAKRKWILGSGLHLAERSCTALVQQINLYSGEKVSAVDRYLGQYAISFKSQYPILQESTTEVVDQVKETASRWSQDGARGIVRSLPGQALLTGLDGLITLSTVVLCYVQPKDYKKKTASPRKSVQINNENGKSGTAAHTHKKMVTKRVEYKKILDGLLRKSGGKSTTKHLLQEVYILLLVSPLRLTVGSMAKLSTWLNRLDGTRKRSRRISRACETSPEKKAEIDSRRKVSPRKRLDVTVFSKLRRTAKRFLGLGSKAISLTQSDIRSYLSNEAEKSPVLSDDGDKKRKYDEIQTDPDSDDTLADFDIDRYLSGEDSDYEVPSDAGSTDSMEYEAGDTESDISVEESNGKAVQVKAVQVKGKDQSKGKVNIGTTSPRKRQEEGKARGSNVESGGKLTNGSDPSTVQNGHKESSKTMPAASTGLGSKNGTTASTKITKDTNSGKDTKSGGSSSGKGSAAEKSVKESGSGPKAGSGP